MSLLFGQKLKELRLEKGLTQFSLSKDFGVSKMTISAWENDKQEPSIDDIIKLARYFDVTTDELLDIHSYDYNFEYKHNNTTLIHKEKNFKE